MESSPSEQPGHPPRRLADVLAERFPQSSKQTLKRMVEQGRVSINRRPARKLTESVRPADAVRIDDSATQSVPQRSLAPLDLIYEDRDLLIINKPAGLLTSTVPNEKRATALAIIQKHYAKTDPKSRIGLIHRLDRDASGLLVFSKNDLAYESLKTQFFHHTVQRIYHAAVQGSPQPPSGTIESNLVEYADGTVHVTKASGKGQRAITHYESLRKHQKLVELRIRLETGRKHQIRVHLASRGCPIVGDTTYAPTNPTKPAINPNPNYLAAGLARRVQRAPQTSTPSSLMLCAVELAFTHPRTQEQLHFKIPIPTEMNRLFLPDHGKISPL
jgi:23S rRNA pseudouridine1911/1915/1917 synthase